MPMMAQQLMQEPDFPSLNLDHLVMQTRDGDRNGTRDGPGRGLFDRYFEGVNKTVLSNCTRQMMMNNVTSNCTRFL